MAVKVFPLNPKGYDRIKKYLDGQMPEPMKGEWSDNVRELRYKSGEGGTISLYSGQEIKVRIGRWCSGDDSVEITRRVKQIQNDTTI